MVQMPRWPLLPPLPLPCAYNHLIWPPSGDCLIILDECHKAKNLLDAAGSE